MQAQTTFTYLTTFAAAVLVLMPARSVESQVHDHSDRAGIALARQYSPDILCGPIALSLAARRLGVNAEVDAIASMVELSSEGCSLSDLARAAETFGLGVESYALPSTEYLAKLDAETPAIVQVRGNHFALIWGAGDSEIFYADYPKKLQKLHHSAVDSTWDPRILLIKRMDAPPVFNGVATRWLSRGLATALAITLLVLTVTSLKRPKGAHRDDSGGSVAS